MWMPNITLLWGRGESTMHFSSNGDQLDDPVVLPMRGGLQNLHIVPRIIQFNDFRFFPGHSPLLVGLGLVRAKFLRGSPLGGRYISHAATSAVDGWCKPNTWRRMHEGVRVEEWHLTTMVRKTWKEWWRGDATSLCTKLGAHCRRIGRGDVERVVWTNIALRCLWIHGSDIRNSQNFGQQQGHPKNRINPRKKKSEKKEENGKLLDVGSECIAQNTFMVTMGRADSKHNPQSFVGAFSSLHCWSWLKLARTLDIGGGDHAGGSSQQSEVGQAEAGSYSHGLPGGGAWKLFLPALPAMWHSRQSTYRSWGKASHDLANHGPLFPACATRVAGP